MDIPTMISLITSFIEFQNPLSIILLVAFTDAFLIKLQYDRVENIFILMLFLGAVDFIMGVALYYLQQIGWINGGSVPLGIIIFSSFLLLIAFLVNPVR